MATSSSAAGDGEGMLGGESLCSGGPRSALSPAAAPRGSTDLNDAAQGFVPVVCSQTKVRPAHPLGRSHDGGQQERQGPFPRLDEVLLQLKNRHTKELQQGA